MYINNISVKSLKLAVVHIFNTSSPSGYRGRLIFVRGQSVLHREFQGNQGFIERFCLKTNNKTQTIIIEKMSRKKICVLKIF